MFPSSEALSHLLGVLYDGAAAALGCCFSGGSPVLLAQPSAVDIQQQTAHT